MSKKIYTPLGWILLLAVGISWIVYGYSNWFLLLFPLAYGLTSVNDEKLRNMRKMSGKQVVELLGAFVVSVALVFGLIQLANFLINDLFHLKGRVKTASQIVSIIFFLYPIKFLFGTVVYKVWSELERESKRS